KPTPKSILYCLKALAQTSPHSQTKWSFIQALEDWQAKFFEKYPKYSEITGTPQLEAAYRLALLTVRLVEPMMCSQIPEGPPRQIWQEQLTAIREVIASLLPHGRDVDGFIASYRQREVERIKLQRLLERIALIFKGAEDRLFEMYSAKNQELKLKLAAFKEKCLSEIREEAAGSQQLHAKIDALNLRMSSLFEAFQSQLEESVGYTEEGVKQKSELTVLLGNLRSIMQQKQ
ncbi:MAG: hypothetical protein KDK40_03060, partial [Chlamydiia bacterium]|nr:hypothetical protein [Chlamydiia bacterium]